MHYIITYIEEFWSLLVEMSPYLLLGFMFAGILHIFMQKNKVANLLKGNNMKSVTHAALLGIPLPLCSCGVIPAGLSFNKNGASKGATVSFLISTPQTGVDSVLVTYSLLGLPMAIIRPVVAFMTGIAGGGIANLFTNKSEVKKVKSVDIYADYSIWQKTKKAFYYGFVEFIHDISKWLIIGLLLAAFLALIIPDDFFTQYANYPLLNMVLVLFASVPLYICATGSVPVAAVLMMKGLSPGAALVFLMAGPATNIATLTVLSKSLGRKQTIVYLATIVVGALVFGYLIDAFLPLDWFVFAEHAHHAHNHVLPHWVGVVSAIVLIVLVINAAIIFFVKNIKMKQNKNKMMEQQENQKIERYKVEGMTCKNCKAHVEKDILDIDGVDNVVADFVTGEVKVSGTNIDHEQVSKAVERAGYVYVEKLDD
jgi:hypothetical protein